jgi:hypothetical protein
MYWRVGACLLVCCNYTKAHAGVGGTNIINDHCVEQQWGSMKTFVAGTSGETRSLSLRLSCLPPIGLSTRPARSRPRVVQRKPAYVVVLQRQTSRFPRMQWPITEDWNHLQSLVLGACSSFRHCGCNGQVATRYW